MRYATAIWNYWTPDTSLAELVEEFAGFGYDTISFSTAQLKTLEPEETREAASLIQDRDLAVTLHGNFEITLADAESFIMLFGARVYSFTCDPAMVSDSRGRFYDAGRMAAFLHEILRMSEGTGLRVAIEDFPLDQTALDYYSSDLAPLLASPRYGILVDVGHLNLRLTGGGYFEGVGILDYMERSPLPVVEVHLHDNDGQRDQHGHFGLGNISFAEVASALKSISFDGVSTIEIAPSLHGASHEESKVQSCESLRRWKELWEG